MYSGGIKIQKSCLYRASHLILYIYIYMYFITQTFVYLNVSKLVRNYMSMASNSIMKMGKTLGILNQTLLNM